MSRKNLAEEEIAHLANKCLMPTDEATYTSFDFVHKIGEMMLYKYDAVLFFFIH